MLDIGWSEMFTIVVLAVVVIGPKQLPQALATLGKYVAKARSLMRDFQSQVDDVVRETELKEVQQKVQQDIQSATSFDSMNFDVKEHLNAAQETPTAKEEEAGKAAAGHEADNMDGFDGDPGLHDDKDLDYVSPEANEAEPLSAENKEPATEKAGAGSA